MRLLSTIALSLFVCANSFADTEPANNNFSTADIISVNGNVSGSVTNGSDTEDYYKIVTVLDGNIQVNLSGSTADYIYLNVFDSDGVTLLYSGTNVGTNGITLTVPGRSAGTYYLSVSQLNGGYNVYNLNNIFTAEAISNDAEPNDSVATALNLTANSTVQGHIGFNYNGGTVDNIDYYKIITANDGNLKFSVLGTEASYMYIFLYDSDGTTQLGTSTNVGTNGVILNVNGLAAGTYYFRIEAYYTTSYNGYTLTDSLISEAISNDVEPNNSAATALNLTPNSTVHGHIGFNYNGGTVDNDDYYKIVTANDGNLKFSVLGTEAAYMYIFLYDSDGTTQLGTSTNVGTNGVALNVNGLAAGTYYFRIAAYFTSSYNGYTLTDSLITEATSNDAEPNDSVATSLNLTPNSTVHGHIGFNYNGGTVDNDDYYKIVTANDGNLKFSVLGTEAAYMYIFLYDSDGTTQLGTSTNVGTNGVALNVNGLAAGTYYFRIAAYFTSSYNGYTLTDSLITEATSNDPEPNDSVATALNLTPNTTVQGHIGFNYNGGTVDNDDYYKIVTTNDGNLKFSVLGTEAAYMYIFLYDSDGTTQLGTSTNVGTNGVALNVNGLAAGTYYFRIAAYFTSSYSGYTLTDSLINEVPVNDSIPNDSVTTANAFLPNSTISGHIGYRYNGGLFDQLDYWKIITTSPGVINIHFVGTQDSYLYLNLYDSSGISSIGGSSGLGTWNLDFASAPQPAGTYYLRIAAFNGPSYCGYTITNAIITALNPIANSSDNFMLSPNPASGSCSIYIEHALANEAAIAITDLSGKTFFTENISIQNNQSIPLHLEGLANGIYLVQLKMNDAVTIKKLVVCR